MKKASDLQLIVYIGGPQWAEIGFVLKRYYHKGEICRKIKEGKKFSRSMGR